MGNKEIFRRFYEEAWNSGDATAADRFLDEGFVNHELTDADQPHREAYKRAIEETRAAFPDWRTEIEDLISEGDRVAARWVSSGTHTGTLPEMRPTGARIRFSGMTVVRIQNGKITDFWKNDDSHTVRHQLEADR